MHLVLGTAQFGLDYGISNNDGKTSRKEVANIIYYAKLVGINILDTAVAYGESEEVIGESIKNNKEFRVITKIPPFQSDEISDKDVEQMESIVNNSLNKLGLDKVYGIMFHAANDVLKKNGERLYSKLLEFKKNNLVQNIGFSVYDSEQIDRLCACYPFDIIQLPLNVLDQRLLKSGHLSKLKSMGIEIYARSIFLQGLLLMDLDNLPRYFKPFRPILEEYYNFLQENELTQLDGAIDFVKNIKEIDYIVVGVNNLEQLITIDKSFETNRKDYLNYDKFFCSNEDIINPRRWNLHEND